MRHLPVVNLGSQHLHVVSKYNSWTYDVYVGSYHLCPFSYWLLVAMVMDPTTHITLKGNSRPNFPMRAPVHAPAVTTTFLPLKVPLLVTTVTTGPGRISVTWWLSSSTPPDSLNRRYVRRNVKVTSTQIQEEIFQL